MTLSEKHSVLNSKKGYTHPQTPHTHPVAINFVRGGLTLMESKLFVGVGGGGSEGSTARYF